jgi:preprotein translocase subunit SecG
VGDGVGADGDGVGAAVGAGVGTSVGAGVKHQLDRNKWFLPAIFLWRKVQ